MKEKIKDLFDEYQSSDMNFFELEKRILDLFIVRLSLPDSEINQKAEDYVSFLRQYQKTCEVIHVPKINAKNFVEQYIYNGKVKVSTPCTNV